MKYHQNPLWFKLLAKGGDVRSKGVLSMDDLFRQSLRLSPQRLVVEIRTRHALVYLEACASGHSCWSTFHSGSAVQTQLRLQQMVAQDRLLDLSGLGILQLSFVSERPQFLEWVCFIDFNKKLLKF